MLEFCESWDHYSNAYILQKWTSADMSGVPGISANGRFGTNCYDAGGRRMISKSFPGGSKTERWIGFAANALFTPGSNWHVLRLTDAGSQQIELRFATSGVMEATRNGSAIPGATGTTVLSAFQYYYYELHIVHDNSAGEIELRINGDVEFALTGVDTQATANATSDRMWFFDPDIGSTTMRIDDIYVLDNVDSGIPGAPNNDFLGDVFVEAIMPNGNGASSEWDGSDGNSTDNYLLVDEIPPDDDTTYVQTGTVAERDLYEYEPLASAAGTIYGIQVMPYAKKTAAGTREIAALTRESGGTVEIGPDISLGTNYAYAFDVRDGDPDGAQWTIASINAAQFGIEVRA